MWNYIKNILYEKTGNIEIFKQKTVKKQTHKKIIKKIIYK